MSYDNEVAPTGTPASIKVGETVITSYDGTKVSEEDIAAAKAAAAKKVEDIKAKPDAKEEDVKKAVDALAGFDKDAKAATLKAKDAGMKAPWAPR